MTGPGSGDEDHAGLIDMLLGKFEEALVERWHQTIYDAVQGSAAIPPALHIYKTSYYTPVWEHRRAEVYAHVKFGDCPALAWYAGGREGAVPTACDGKIREPGETGMNTIHWPPTPDGTEVEVPESTDCGIGLLFAEGTEWAYQDRKYIFDRLPMFANQKLSVLESARNALVGMAADFGGVAGEEGESGDPAMQTSLQLADDVDAIFVQRDDETDWRADWTGTAADRAAEGFFASTKPTLCNHALMANGLSTLINERATIIHTYRLNTIELIMAATEALGAETETTTDLSKLWKVVQGLGGKLSASLAPAARPVGTVVTVVGWLGDKFLGEFKDVSFSYGPGEVAIDLYDQVVEMSGTLSTAEEQYVADVAAFREAVNAVPSTFLELYDLTENSPTGTH